MKCPVDPMNTLFERLEKHTERIPELTCWVWTAATNLGGYGQIVSGGRFGTHLSAHRVAYEKYKGPIPKGMTIDHLCRNRWCVNPRHLEAVSMRENVLRGNGPTALNARKTHCPQGHSYTPENTYRFLSRKGRRRCKACAAKHLRKWRHKFAVL